MYWFFLDPDYNYNFTCIDFFLDPDHVSENGTLKPEYKELVSINGSLQSKVEELEKEVLFWKAKAAELMVKRDDLTKELDLEKGKVAGLQNELDVEKQKVPELLAREL